MKAFKIFKKSFEAQKRRENKNLIFPHRPGSKREVLRSTKLKYNILLLVLIRYGLQSIILICSSEWSSKPNLDYCLRLAFNENVL